MESLPSRRSLTNLTHLTLAPLSSRLPIDSDSDDDEPHLHQSLSAADYFARQPTSYIQGKSAPTTPGILSRSSSSKRLSSIRKAGTPGAGSKSYTHLSFAIDGTAAADDAAGIEKGGGAPLAKAKSTTVLVQQPQQRRRKGNRTPRGTDHGEWLHRAGTAISASTLEAKGQSWLVSRDSSTSLVQQTREERDASGDVVRIENMKSPRGSRLPSARTSRRGSRVGSRIDLGSALMTPARSRADMTITDEDYFTRGKPSIGASHVLGPDFVNHEDEGDDEESINSEEEDAEVAKLARDKGFGLGGIIDRFIGWTLFETREGDGADTEDDGDVERIRQEEERYRQKALLKGARDQAKASVGKSVAQPSGNRQPQAKKNEPEAEEGGWKDAAWLLSVASKVLY